MEPIEIDVLLLRPIPIRMRWEDDTTADYNLPRLGAEGLLPWLDELTKIRQDELRAEVSALKLKGNELATANFSISQMRATIADLSGIVREPKGIRRVIELSVAASDVPAEKRAEVVNYLMGNADVSYSLMMRLSTLFPTGEVRPPKPAPQAGGPFDIGEAAQSPKQEGDTKSQSSPPDSNTTGSLSI